MALMIKRARARNLFSEGVCQSWMRPRPLIAFSLQRASKDEERRRHRRPYLSASSSTLSTTLLP